MDTESVTIDNFEEPGVEEEEYCHNCGADIWDQDVCPECGADPLDA